MFKPLNDAQEAFCEEYLVDLNAARAYRVVYPASSAKSAEVSGFRLLRNAKVSTRIQALMAARSARTLISADRTMKEVARIAHSDMRNFLEWGEQRTEKAMVKAKVDGVDREVEIEVPVGGFRLKASSSLSDDDAACVAEVKATPGPYGVTITFKLHSKGPALELLARHQGLLNDKLRLNDGEPIEIVQMPPRPPAPEKKSGKPAR